MIPAPSLIPIICRYQKFSETKKATSYETFRLCETKQFRRKIVIPAPLLLLTCFDTKNFLKLRRVPLPNASVLWDKTILTENPDTHPLFIQKFFHYRKFSVTQHRSVPQRNFSILWDKKYSTENRDTPPPLMHKIFDTRIFLKHRRVPLQNFSVLWGKIFDKRSWHTPLMHKIYRYPNFVKH